MSVETHGAQADTTTTAPQPLPADTELVVDATYQQGVLTPHCPLALPEGTPVRLHVTLLAAPAPRSGWRWSPLARYIHGLSAWERFTLAAAGLLLAWSGQGYFHDRLAFTWEGLLLALGGLALLVLALAGLNNNGLTEAAHVPLAPPIALSPWRKTALLLAVGCIGLLLFALASEPPWPSYNWGFGPWLGAIGLYLLALAPPRQPQRRAWRTRWQNQRGPVLVVAAIVAIALGLRVWNLGGIPPTLGGDEGSQGLEAVKILKGEITNPFSTGWLGVPTMSFYFNAPTIWLMGNTMEALRLPWALMGTATVLATFLLVRHLHGNLLALLTAALLAGYHYHIHYSRLGSNQVADALFVALALLLLYRGYDRRSSFDWALCGVVVGVAQFFYAGARFTAIIVVVTTAFLALRDGRRFWQEQRWGLLALLGAGLLSAAPMLQYAYRFPDAYNARLGMVGIVQSGWLERELAIRNQGVLPILLDQFVRAAFAFTAYPDRTVWYGSPRPLLLLEEGTLFLLGFGLALLHMGNRRIFPLVAWWGGAMILGGMLTESPPSSQRLITMAVPALFFVALALVQLGRMVGLVLGTARRLVQPALALAVLLLALVSLRWYFVQYTPLLVYGNFNAVVATALGKYAQAELGPETQVYFFGPPRMFYSFGTIPYLAPGVSGTDISEPLTQPPARNLVLPDKEAAFVFLPERRAELALVQQTFPGGTLMEMPSPLGAEPLFIVYRINTLP